MSINECTSQFLSTTSYADLLLLHYSSNLTEICAVTGCLQRHSIRPVTSAWQPSGDGCSQCGPLSFLAYPGQQSLLST